MLSCAMSDEGRKRVNACEAEELKKGRLKTVRTLFEKYVTREFAALGFACSDCGIRFVHGLRCVLTQ